MDPKGFDRSYTAETVRPSGEEHWLSRLSWWSWRLSWWSVSASGTENTVNTGVNNDSGFFNGWVPEWSTEWDNAPEWNNNQEQVEPRKVVAPGEEFAKGARVQVKDLLSAPEYNDQYGIIRGYLPDKEMYKVKFEMDGKTKGVNVKNIYNVEDSFNADEY